MKKILSLLLLPGISFFLEACHTYSIAETTVPTELFYKSNHLEIDSTVSAGSIVLLKGTSKDGMIQARYHADPTWYWISSANISAILNINSKSYNQIYTSLESANPAGVILNAGYNATIQTGSRGGQYYINKNGKKTYLKHSTSSGRTKTVGGKGSRGGRH